LIAPLASLEVHWLAPLAAMFAGKPPSSSNPTKQLSRGIFSTLTFRQLLLQIGGANIAAARIALSSSIRVS
jgi:hypothetical protein